VRSRAGGRGRNEPIAGAIVRCPHVRTSGEGLIHAAGKRRCRDRQRRPFRHLCRRRESGPAIWRLRRHLKDVNRCLNAASSSANSRIASTSTFPATIPFPVPGRLTNTDFVTLRLQRSNVPALVSLRSAGRGFLDAAKLGAGSRFYYKKDASSERQHLPARYLAGGKLIPGTYTGPVRPDRVSTLTVTPRRVPEPIFRLPPAITYAGKVGTASPATRWRARFVIGMNGTANTASRDWMLRRGRRCATCRPIRRRTTGRSRPCTKRSRSS